ncbi:MAG: hypothetical protein ACXWOH_12170 [Bdellovibrionota bacterium]
MYLRQFVLHQIVRYGAMDFESIHSLLRPHWGRTNLYRTLAALCDAGVIARVMHPTKRMQGWAALSYGHDAAYGSETDLKYREIRLSDLRHMFFCARVLSRFCFFPNVSGVASERELLPADIAQFSGNKVPDGIVEITRDGKNFECAVEVEVTHKAASRVQKIVSGYEKLLRDPNGECRGVIFVVLSPELYRSYEKALARVSEDVRNRMLLLCDPKLSELKPHVFGEPLFGAGLNPYLPQYKLRTSHKDELRYVPWDSATYREEKAKLSASNPQITVPSPDLAVSGVIHE